MADDRSSQDDELTLDRLDQDVARGVAQLEAWRSDLAAGPESPVADEEPLEPVRRIAGQSTFLALEGMNTSDADRPLRDALRPWVYYLLQARVGRADDLAWAGAAGKTTTVDRGETRSTVGWREAWRGAVAAPTAPSAAPWLEAAAALAPELASVCARRASRRVEVARRLGLGHPWEPLVGAPIAALRDAATRFLAATDDLWRVVLRDELPSEQGVAAVIVAATARDAGEGWPARLTPQALRDLVPRAFDEPGLALPRLPAALGAASFVRALAALGFAVRARRPSSVPFALAREPAFVAAHRLGFVLGSLAADRTFQSRALRVGSRAAAAQARVLARTALFEARLLAVRLLLGDEAAFAPRDLFDELTARMFGRSLDRRFAGAWPAARDDEPARWIAALETVRAADGLRERFDIDWYRNPRAWRELRGATLAREPIDDGILRGGAADLARVFEGALG